MACQSGSPVAYGLIATVNQLRSAWYSRWLDKLQPLAACAGGMGLIGVGIAVTGAGRGVVWFCAVGVSWTVGEIFLFGPGVAFVASIAPPGREGSYLGFWDTTLGLSILTASALLSRHSRLWSRDYASPASVNRAALGIRKRFPEARIEVTVFTLRPCSGWPGPVRPRSCAGARTATPGSVRPAACGAAPGAARRSTPGAVRLSQTSRPKAGPSSHREWCEDPETSGILGQVARVCVHARKAVKVKTHDATTHEIAAILEHELRHIRGAAHAGDEPALGLARGGHTNAFGQPVSRCLTADEGVWVPIPKDCECPWTVRRDSSPEIRVEQPWCPVHGTSSKGATTKKYAG